MTGCKMIKIVNKAIRIKRMIQSQNTNKYKYPTKRAKNILKNRV